MNTIQVTLPKKHRPQRPQLSNSAPQGLLEFFPGLDAGVTFTAQEDANYAGPAAHGWCFRPEAGPRYGGDTLDDPGNQGINEQTYSSAKYSPETMDGWLNVIECVHRKAPFLTVSNIGRTGSTPIFP